MTPDPITADPDTRPRRRYDSPVRRQRAAETRERIIAAGAAILHDHAVWNFDALTVRGVAERAEVNERTVYRHFATERELRDAVMTRLEGEAGVELDGLALEDVRGLTAQILGYASSFPLDPRAPRDATLVATHQRLRDALLAAVAAATDRWTDTEQAIAAAMLDVLWSVTSYERLVADWHLDPDDAIRGATWVIGLVENAIRGGAKPA
jgi:AcrR family transcriptional regulator